jgi:hypothetical protein
MASKPDQGRSVPTRAIYAGIGLCALLAVVALASRGSRPASSGGSSSRALPGDVFDYVFTFSILLALVMVAAAAYLRATAGPERKKAWELRQMVMFVVAIAAVSVAAVVIAEQLRENPNQGLARLIGDRTTSVRTDAEGRPVQPTQPEFEWAAVLIAGALVGVGYGVYRLGRKKRPPEDRTLREDLAAILDDTLGKLWDEQDPRRAVILAYAWMERTLGAHGLPRVPSEAPLEYLARVLIDLDASRESVFELTALFERAKFSPHDVDEAMKHEAIAALTAVRDDLRAVQAEAA